MPLGALLLGLLVAFGFGAAHALSPGHGKTIVAAYLVGSRGTAVMPAFLGLVVTISHTVGVFLLGLIVLYASEYIVPEKIYPWLGFGLRCGGGGGRGGALFPAAAHLAAGALRSGGVGSTCARS